MGNLLTNLALTRVCTLHAPTRHRRGMFEHRKQPVLPADQFGMRMLRHVMFSMGLLAAALAAGAAGYHFIEGFALVDSILNASMLLGGMGPVDTLHTVNGKLFASAYAMFSGLSVLAVAGMLFAPVLHRLLHRFHLELDERDSRVKEPADT